MNFLQLKKLQEGWNGKVCLFGAGMIGRTWAYDLLKKIGFDIDFYCDNKIGEGSVVRDGIKNISLTSLYELGNDVLVFITVWDKYQSTIKAQLNLNGINNIIETDFYFLQDFCESLLRIGDEKVNEQFSFVLDDEQFLKMRFEAKMGYPLDLNNPVTYNEKLQWLKLHDREKRYEKLVDKYEAKDHISKYIGERYIVPTYGIWNNFDTIDFDALPDKFVLKCTHDSGSVVICNDKNTFNWEEAKKIFENALKRNLYWFGREWPYRNVKPRIMAEKYLVDLEDGELRDYKLFCFHGKVKALLIALGRMDSNCETRTNFFDDKLNPLNMTSGHPNSLVPPHMPVHYEEMKEIAEKLSVDIPHIRIDFYEVNGKIYIGELTFYHQSGFVPIEPRDKDIEWGTMINLNKVHRTEIKN